MSSINDICGKILNDADGALGVAVVDLSTGLLLGAAHDVPYFTQTYIDAVASAAVEMFRGKGIKSVEKLISQQRGETLENSIKEVQMSTTNTFHYMSTVPGKPNALAVLITSNKTNLGMGWAALRGALPDLEPLCP
ncbi:MAG: hypothetical protein L3J89_02195 [Gammaproteobacteria bacterium]|nr:hypothetical protein [Gammaproteobacteria bacterium]